MTSWWWQLKCFKYFHLYLGKMNPFWRAYVSNGLKPPTRINWWRILVFYELFVIFCLNLSFSKYNKHIYCEFSYVPVKTFRPSKKSKSFKGLKGMFNQFWERLLEFSKCNFRICVGSSFAHIQNHGTTSSPSKINPRKLFQQEPEKIHLGYKGKNHLNLPPPCILVPAVSFLGCIPLKDHGARHL